jgi:hypothetical protein
MSSQRLLCSLTGWMANKGRRPCKSLRLRDPGADSSGSFAGDRTARRKTPLLGHKPSCAVPWLQVWHDLGFFANCIYGLWRFYVSWREPHAWRFLFQLFSKRTNQEVGRGSITKVRNGGHTRGHGPTQSGHLIPLRAGACRHAPRQDSSPKEVVCSARNTRKDAAPLSFQAKVDLGTPIGYRHNTKETLAPAHSVQGCRR